MNNQNDLNNQLKITGSGPVNAEIFLKGLGVSEKTYSNEVGLFEFSKIYSLTPRYPELCLYAKKDTATISNAVCIPALPENGEVPKVIGPIVLSPIIEFKDGILTGSTVPNSEVTLLVNGVGKGLTSDSKGEFKENLLKLNTFGCRFVSASINEGPLSNTLDCSPKWILDKLLGNKITV